MPAEQDQEKILVQLATMREQMSSMANSVDDIKKSVQQVIELDRTIIELNAKAEQSAREIATQWRKIDDNHVAIETVDKKADEWINKARGAWWIAMLFGGAIQLGVFAVIGWTFTHMRAAEDGVLLLNQRVMQIEQQVKGGRP